MQNTVYCLVYSTMLNIVVTKLTSEATVATRYCSHTPISLAFHPGISFTRTSAYDDPLTLAREGVT